MEGILLGPREKTDGMVFGSDNGCVGRNVEKRRRIVELIRQT